MRKRLIPLLIICFLIAFATLPVCLATAQEKADGEITDKKVSQKDQTGTDPRGFAPKFMPYYRYVELDNNFEAQMMTLFGMFAFNPRFAMTYEWPIAKYIDYSNVDAFKNGQGFDGTPGSPGGGPPSTGIPFDDLDDDGDVIGMGDLGLRFFFKPEALEWTYESGRGGSLMFGAEMLFPTATEDVLGSGSFILSPMLTLVHDTPLHGFIAAMNFYDFDVFKDDSRSPTSRYRGRWFLMQPLTKPGPWYGGLYLLPEFQPVYDFKAESFSFWVGPELGKILAPGKIVYAKPGWGIKPQPNEREFTFEVGWRWFF